MSPKTNDSRGKPANANVALDQQTTKLKIKRLEQRLEIALAENELFRRSHRETQRQYEGDIRAGLTLDLQDMTGWSTQETKVAINGLSNEQLKAMIDNYSKINIAGKSGTPHKPYRSIKAGAGAHGDVFTVPDVYGKTRSDIAKIAGDL